MRSVCSAAVAVFMVLLAAVSPQANAQQPSKNLAPGFTARSANSKIVVVPVDLELFSISAGGVSEPRADWTQSAGGHFRSALNAASARLGSLNVVNDLDWDDMAELNALHGALAQSVVMHHLPGHLKLPTKNDQLNWSMGDAIQPLHDKTGADYALFFWVRDSYASSERKAAMIALALLGVGVAGGAQVGYASLVDLQTGQVVWFNTLVRASGDLRDAVSATETVNVLMTGFPPIR